MFGIYDLLDYILPCSDRSKNDILRLEYLSACKLMENEKDIIKILHNIPAAMFESLLQSVIYKYYLEFIGNLCINRSYDREILKCKKIMFPNTLGVLILNWPHAEFILRDNIYLLQPPFEMLQNKYGPFASQYQVICEAEDILRVFDIYCHRLIQFITHFVFKYTERNRCRRLRSFTRNTHGCSCHLRRLDLSGLGRSNHTEECITWPDEILEGIRKSTIDAFGHNIDIVADVQIGRIDPWRHRPESSPLDYASTFGFQLLKNIIKDSFNPNYGISVYLNNITYHYILDENSGTLPVDFFNAFSHGGCKYIQLKVICIDTKSVENLCKSLPELVGISSYFQSSIGNLDFLSTLEHLEHVSLCTETNIGLINSLSNMSKGLKYLNISECCLKSKDLECLAKSIHSETLLELNLSHNNIANDSEADGLIMLCQKLINVKVFTVECCSLDILSTISISKVVNALKDCVKLEFLSMKDNPFRLAVTNIIIDGLAQNKSLRYLCLDFPGDQCYLSKTFHQTMNKCRSSPIYISWCDDDDDDV